MNHFYESIDGWSTMEEQGELLQILLKKININSKINICEIGVYKGRMTSLWNVILINHDIFYSYIGIDHFSGSTEHDHTINYYDITKENLKPIEDYIYIINNDSINESRNWDDNYFDIIYIDGNHDYYSVANDLKVWFPKLKAGGYICGDDLTTGWPGVIEAVEEKFGKSVKKFSNQQWYFRKKGSTEDE